MGFPLRHPIIPFDIVSVSQNVWANGKGFEAADHVGNLTINSVAITASNQVTITLFAPPSTGLVISYAYTADSTNAGGFTARGGNLKDSSGYIGPTSGAALPNWCIGFTKTGLT